MTAFDRARAWFLEPADRPARSSSPAGTSPRAGAAPSSPAATSPAVAGPPSPAATSPAVAGPPSSAGSSPAVAGPPSSAGSSPAVAEPPSPAAASPPGVAGPPRAALHEVSSAAVLGRPGEAEPVAASLALALSRGGRGRPGAVAVLGGSAAPAAGGTPAARRLATRLEGQGLSAQPRGRLVWVPLPADGAEAAARRVALVCRHTVLAVAAPRTAKVDELLAEQDLIVVVTADPDGPLARLALAAPGTAPVIAVRPLGRGLARALACGGVRPGRSIREVTRR
jgi:hypothetical protein